jgi:hypothetical protein
MGKLFIDINGTITSYKLKGEIDGNQGLKEGAEEFFTWVTHNFDCYWLSNAIPRGMMFGFKRNILPLLPPVAASIKPGVFSALKTEAIKDGDFFWIDDNLLAEEKKYLEDNGWLDRYIYVDPDATSMAPVISEIKRRLHAIKRNSNPEKVDGDSGSVRE